MWFLVRTFPLCIISQPRSICEQWGSKGNFWNFRGNKKNVNERNIILKKKTKQKKHDSFLADRPEDHDLWEAWTPEWNISLSFMLAEISIKWVWQLLKVEVKPVMSDIFNASPSLKSSRIEKTSWKAYETLLSSCCWPLLKIHFFVKHSV